MELRQLRYFQKAAQLESITRAAAFFQIPQPAMSQCIVRLEKELGDIKLFDRKNHRLYLNENGRCFLAYVDRMLNELDTGVQVMAQRKQEISGEIRLLVMENRRFVLSCVSRFSKMYPGVHFSISHEYYSDGEIPYDLCISARQQHGQMHESCPLIRERVVLGVHEDHPLAERNQVNLRDFREEKFITMPAPSALHEITLDACRHAGFEPDICIVCDDPYFIRKYVSEKMGVALGLEVSWAGRFRVNTRAIPLDDPPVYACSYLLWDGQKYMSPAVILLRDYLLQEAKHLRGNMLYQEE